MNEMDINSKTSPIQMREFIKRVRTGNFINEFKNNKPQNNLTIYDMLKITRNLNESDKQNKKTIYDQIKEEEKFLNFFNDLNVTIKFIELEIYDDMIFWGGTINGVIQFVYKVTSDEKTSGIEFNYLDGFNPDDPDNNEIIKRIESYYNTFYKYWRNNIIQKG